MKLGELVSIRKGKKPEAIVATPGPGYRRLIQIDDLRSDAKPKFCPPARDEQVADPSDVIIAWDGANAGTSSFGLAGVIGSTLAVLRPKNGGIDTSYLGHFVRSKRQYLRQRCKGATVPHIESRILKNLDLPMPPVAEQRRIAEILEQAEALRAKRRTALTTLHSLTQALFSNLFGPIEPGTCRWPIQVLGKLISKNDKINYGVVQPGDDHADGIPLVRVGDFEGMSVNTSGLKRIAPRIDAEYGRSRLHGEEVLLSCVGATIGKVALATNGLKGFNIARAVARITAGESIDRLFLAHYLLTKPAQAFFRQETRAVGQPTLNITQIEETPVPVPPIGLQREFGCRITALEKLKASHHASLAQMDALFTSLQHRAFRGEL